MRIAYLGSGEFGLPTLRALADRHTIACVVSQPDRPAGRGGKLTPTPIAAFAAEHLTGVPLIKPEDVNASEVVAAIHGTKPDAMVVIAFGQKLSPQLVEPGTPNFRGAINLHASLLPRHRGAAPINWAILSGDSVTGNSVISIAQRMDAGLIFGQSRRPIEPAQTAGELHDLLSQDGPALVIRVLDDLAAGRAQGLTQDESLKTRAGKLSREMAGLDLRDTAEACRRRINGLSPWPGVTVQFRGQPLKLLKALAHPSHRTHDAPAGRILDPRAGLIGTGEGALQLLEVQPAGKRSMSWGDFANGAQINPEESLTGETPC